MPLKKQTAFTSYMIRLRNLIEAGYFLASLNLCMKVTIFATHKTITKLTTHGKHTEYEYSYSKTWISYSFILLFSNENTEI